MDSDVLLSAITPLIPRELLASPGGSPRETAPQSHYQEEIEQREGRLSGRSRRWGDISNDRQRQVVDLLLGAARREGWSLQETAFLAAVARTESGFNPDAAAASSSASGLGQFIDATGRALGMAGRDRFDVCANISALVKHLGDCLRQGRSTSGSGEAGLVRAYALYHDGPSLKHGGGDIARRTVLPWTGRFLGWLEQSAYRPSDVRCSEY